jgi:hypothetical protein
MFIRRMRQSQPNERGFGRLLIGGGCRVLPRNGEEGRSLQGPIEMQHQNREIDLHLTLATSKARSVGCVNEAKDNAWVRIDTFAASAMYTQG